jgi:two-component system phosphate regulon sensor histidine kinase PhoR
MNEQLPDRIRSAMALGPIVMSVGAVAAAVLAAAGSISWIVAFWILVVVSVGISLLVLTRVRGRLAADSATIRAMTLAARQSADGHFDREIDLSTIETHELRQLAEMMNAAVVRARQDIAELDRLGRVRSEFLGNVSHELRTPIFSVQGYLETLLDGAADDPSVRDEFIHKAHHNVMRLHHLLSDLIEISRIESGEMKLSFRYFDAIDFFSGIVEEMRPTAEIAGIHLEMRTLGRAGNGRVFGDRERRKQAAVNLIENAIKYNRPDGAVRVDLEFLDRELEVRVSDTGLGIPAEHLPRIFERFYRVDRNRSRAVGGSGLGLAIVKHIIEAHRGTITVNSQPDLGTTFAFRLKR